MVPALKYCTRAQWQCVGGLGIQDGGFGLLIGAVKV